MPRSLGHNGKDGGICDVQVAGSIEGVDLIQWMSSSDFEAPSQARVGVDGSRGL